MVLFTGRHYRDCAADAGMASRSRARRKSTLVLTSIPAAVSPRWADWVMIRVEADLLATA